jgi:hypothetical protein
MRPRNRDMSYGQLNEFILLGHMDGLFRAWCVGVTQPRFLTPVVTKEQENGIGPSSTEYETVILPLNYSCILGLPNGFEPLLYPYQGYVLPLNEESKLNFGAPPRIRTEKYLITGEVP